MRIAGYLSEGRENGEPWFVLKDVCEVLGLSDTNKTAQRLDPNQVRVRCSISHRAADGEEGQLL